MSFIIIFGPLSFPARVLHYRLAMYSVVSEECYPYTSGRTDKTGDCLLPRRPSSEASVDCPQPPPATSRLYQATPPYRIAPTVRIHSVTVT